MQNDQKLNKPLIKRKKNCNINLKPSLGETRIIILLRKLLTDPSIRKN